jgi:hypothetical protein
MPTCRLSRLSSPWLTVSASTSSPRGSRRVAQLDRLRALGCDRGQGYFYARPLPPEELGPMLAAGIASATTVAADPLPSPAVRPRASRRKQRPAESAPIARR